MREDHVIGLENEERSAEPSKQREAFQPAQEVPSHWSRQDGVVWKELALVAGGTGAGRVSGVLCSLKRCLGLLVVRDLICASDFSSGC